jgi:hypothetical protein
MVPPYGLNSQATCVYRCGAPTDCGTTGFGCEGGFCCGKKFFRCCHTGTTCAAGSACGADDYCQ